MRRIIMFNRVTPEGYFSTSEGGLDWAVPDDELDQAATEGMPGGDTILFGRRTYDMFEAFWPHALDEAETSDPHAPNRKSPAIRAMAVWINEAHKLVFSRTRKDLTWKNSRPLGEFDPNKVEAIKREPGKDMMIFGSGSIVSLLTEHRLIDEYRFVVSPILLGSGRGVFTHVSKRTRLELKDVKRTRAGNVSLCYVPST